MKKNRKHYHKKQREKKRNKKAVSVVIGYVMLVVIGIFMSVVVYNYLKTYVPTDSVECPDQVSLFIQKTSCTDNKLTVTLKNNGKFNLYGYFIKATPNKNISVATIDLATMINETNSSGFAANSTIYFNKDSTIPLKPDEISLTSFNLTRNISLIEIIPLRTQEEDFKEELVACSNIKISEEIDCNTSPPIVYSSSTLCTDDGYDSGTGLSDYIVGISNPPAYTTSDTLCGNNGNYLLYTDDLANPSSLIFQTPSLPGAADYNLTFKVKRGAQDNESYRIECGTRTHEIPEENEPLDLWRNESVLCDFEGGQNNITLTGTGLRGSVHFENFWIFTN